MAKILEIITKKVKVFPKNPIHVNKDLTISRPTEEAIEMTVGNIQRCMLLGAKVFEVLDDGTEIMLYRNNFNKDNSKQKEIDEKVEDKEDEKKDSVVTEPIKKEDVKPVIDVKDTKAVTDTVKPEDSKTATIVADPKNISKNKTAAVDKAPENKNSIAPASTETVTK